FSSISSDRRVNRRTVDSDEPSDPICLLLLHRYFTGSTQSGNRLALASFWTILARLDPKVPLVDTVLLGNHLRAFHDGPGASRPQGRADSFRDPRFLVLVQLDASSVERLAHRS